MSYILHILCIFVLLFIHLNNSFTLFPSFYLERKSIIAWMTAKSNSVIIIFTNIIYIMKQWYRVMSDIKIPFKLIRDKNPGIIFGKKDFFFLLNSYSSYS